MTVETGPRADSPDCPAVDCLQTVVKRSTDNVNKALVIDYTDTRLIACGTIFQGRNSINKKYKENIRNSHRVPPPSRTGASALESDGFNFDDFIFHF